MATLGLQMARKITEQVFRQRPNGQLITQKAMTYSDTGALLPKPDQTRFATLKVLAVVLPFLYTGATISKKGAAFLEENDIFVPDDDDD